MESFEPLLTNDAAEDQKPAAVDVTAANKSEEPQRNIERMDSPASNLSSLFASQEEDATKGFIASSLDNFSEGGRRSCCSYFLVVLIAAIVAFILTRQYDS